MHRLRKNFPILILLLAATALTSCRTDEGPADISAPTVILHLESTGDSSAVVSIVPSANASGFRYALGLPEDEETFLSGGLTGTLDIPGNDSLSIELSPLEQDRVYTVFAQAYDSYGLTGGLASMDVLIPGNGFTVSTQYITGNSAGFRFDYSPQYTVRYYLGRSGEKDSFETEEITGTYLPSVILNDYCCANFFDLEEGDYVLYAQATDISGRKGDVVEIPFSTTTDVPGMTYTAVSSDAYKCVWSFEPDDKCGKLYVTICNETQSSVINDPVSFNLDFLTCLDGWCNRVDSGTSPWPFHGYTTDAPLEITYLDATFALNQELEAYALFYDLEGNPCGVQKIPLSKPAEDPSAPAANVTITVSDITANGATYTYTADENTMGFFFDTVTEEWFEENAAADSRVLHNYLLQQGYYWAYKDDLDENRQITFTETIAEPGQTYYAVACPMNINGTAGWSDLVYVKYTTLTE